jgi:hypothetical protein
MSITVGGPNEFKSWMEKTVREDVPNWQAQMHQKIHFQVDRGVVLGTPVGNPELWQNPGSAPPGYAGGRARGNWQASTGSPTAGEVERIDKSGSETIGSNGTVIQTIRPFSRSFETNNVPYIIALNDGLPPGKQHSKQAPLQWIEGVLEKIEAQFKSDTL